MLMQLSSILISHGDPVTQGGIGVASLGPKHKRTTMSKLKLLWTSDLQKYNESFLPCTPDHKCHCPRVPPAQIFLQGPKESRVYGQQKYKHTGVNNTLIA